MIVLSDAGIVKDLIDKKGQIYSSRPDTWIGKMLSQGQRIVTEVILP